MSGRLSRWLSFLFVKDYNCIVCGRELPGKERLATCSSCYAKMEFNGDAACVKCGKRLIAEEEYCLDCQHHEKHFDRAFSPLCYTGAAAGLVRDLKFYNKRYFAAPMARYMTDDFLQREVTADVVLSVPLYEKREKERGYNQSELLAREIANALGLPLVSSAAERIKYTLPSTLLEGGRNAREENIAGAFVIKDAEAVKNRDVLIVDDVLTTGATTSELAKMLKKAGARKVYVITFASTRDKPPVERDSI